MFKATEVLLCHLNVKRKSVLQNMNYYKSKKAIASECTIALTLVAILFLLFYRFTTGWVNSIGTPLSLLPLVVVVRNLIRLKKPLIIFNNKELFFNSFTKLSKIESLKIITIYKKQFFEIQTKSTEQRIELNSFTPIDIKRLKTTKPFRKN